MTGRTLELIHATARENALQAVREAPVGHVVVVRPKSRSLDQNAKLHALLGDIAKQAKFGGDYLTAVQWKTIFISGHAIATGLGARMVPGLEGEFVNIRESSANMSVARMASLIEYIQAWAANNCVQLQDEGMK